MAHVEVVGIQNGEKDDNDVCLLQVVKSREGSDLWLYFTHVYAARVMANRQK